MLELTKKEGKALVGILHTEIIETEDLVNNENQSKQDKKELEKYLAVVKSILAKLEQCWDYCETILIFLKKFKIFVEICISNHYIISERNAKYDIRKRQLTKV